MITKVQKYLLNKLPQKLLKHIVIEISTGCWLWQVNINSNGYGRNFAEGKRHMVHITIYKMFKGEYAEGLLLDHVYCRHRNCCNPVHLSPVTPQQNTYRGRAVLIKPKGGGFFNYLKVHGDPNDTFLSDLL